MGEAAAEFIVKVVVFLQKIETKVKTLDLSPVLADGLADDLRDLLDRLLSEFGDDESSEDGGGGHDIEEEDGDGDLESLERKWSAKDSEALENKLEKRIEVFQSNQKTLEEILLLLAEIVQLLRDSPNHAEERFVEKITEYVRIYSGWRDILHEKLETYHGVLMMLDRAEKCRQADKSEAADAVSSTLVSVAAGETEQVAELVSSLLVVNEAD